MHTDIQAEFEALYQELNDIKKEIEALKEWQRNHIPVLSMKDLPISTASAAYSNMEHLQKMANSLPIEDLYA